MASTEYLQRTSKANKSKKEADKIFCIYHGEDMSISNNWYQAGSATIWKNAKHGKIPICKSCIDGMYIDYYTRSKNTKWSVYKMCEKLDIPFINSIFEGAMQERNDEWQKIFGAYMKTYNSFASKNNWEYNFDNSENVELDFDGNENFDVKGITTKLSNADKRVIKDVEHLLGYLPFEGYSDSDQKFLYNDLINYLDEETVEDQYKISQLLQICNNNNQINKYNFLISQYSADPKLTMEHVDKLKSFNGLIKDIVASNDKIAKENGISGKNKGSSSMNKTSLTGKMKFLSENNFDDIEVDYYDQKKAYGMQFSADISMKAIRSQIAFDENDLNDLIVMQRELIKGLQSKVDNLEEESRLLNIKLRGNEGVIYG